MKVNPRKTRVVKYKKKQSLKKKPIKNQNPNPLKTKYHNPNIKFKKPLNLLNLNKIMIIHLQIVIYQVHIVVLQIDS